MARILMVGIDPSDVDYSDPALPAGLTADMIRQGIARGIEELRGSGHEPQPFFIPADLAGLDGLRRKLAAEQFDCVTIGGGVRLPARHLHLFEAVINIIAGATPPPAIALVARPEEAAASVSRVLAPGHV